MLSTICITSSREETNLFTSKNGSNRNRGQTSSNTFLGQFAPLLASMHSSVRLRTSPSQTSIHETSNQTKFMGKVCKMDWCYRHHTITQDQEKFSPESRTLLSCTAQLLPQHFLPLWHISSSSLLVTDLTGWTNILRSWHAVVIIRTAHVTHRATTNATRNLSF